MQPPKATPGSLVGFYFHSFHADKPKELNWQGQVVARAEQGLFVCQLFSWMDGRPTNCVLVRVEDMALWKFYQTEANMHDEYALHAQRRRAREAREAAAAAADTVVVQVNPFE